jgi:hypothetical protein
LFLSLSLITGLHISWKNNGEIVFIFWLFLATFLKLNKFINSRHRDMTACFVLQVIDDLSLSTYDEPGGLSWHLNSECEA